MLGQYWSCSCFKCTRDSGLHLKSVGKTHFNNENIELYVRCVCQQWIYCINWKEFILLIYFTKQYTIYLITYSLYKFYFSCFYETELTDTRPQYFCLYLTGVLTRILSWRRPSHVTNTSVNLYHQNINRSHTYSHSFLYNAFLHCPILISWQLVNRVDSNITI